VSVCVRVGLSGVEGEEAPSSTKNSHGPGQRRGAWDSEVSGHTLLLARRSYRVLRLEVQSLCSDVPKETERQNLAMINPNNRQRACIKEESVATATGGEDSAM
jgi:hypothetical protein